MSGTENIYRFKVGSFNCTVFCDGRETSSYENGHWLTFVNATDDEVVSTHRAYSQETGDPAVEDSMNVLMIDTGDHRVLVDTGCGPNSDRAGMGKLFGLLDEAGIAKSDIDTIITTHNHWDHVDGNTDGEGHPAFPNARYVISQVEFDAVSADPDESGQQQILAIADHFDKIPMDAEIIPGIRAVPARGHTLGQIGLLIESDGERLLHTADTFHHAVELYRPEWFFDFDADPEATVTTRRRIFDMASREHLPVMTYHLTFPGLGYIEKDGDHYTWRPKAS